MLTIFKNHNVKYNKYNARKVKVNDQSFDSTGEYKRWLELKILEREGEITNLKRQKRFPLTCNNVLICTYVADFTYNALNGDFVVEDYKSSITKKNRDYIIKKKLLKACYNIDILETYN